MKKNITLATLAEQLNVTTTTVSKALRGKPGIGAKTVEKVQALAQELNYRPNFAAQSLKSKSANTVGLLITLNITNPWYAQLVSSIETELSRCGKTMILSLGKSDYAKERNCLEAFRGGRVEGVIVGPIFRKRNLENIWRALDLGLPMVFFNCMDEMPVDYVAIDQAAGAKIAVNYLIEAGHRNIGYLCCDHDASLGLRKTRREGFEEALFEHNIPLWGKNIIGGSETKRGGYETMKQLLQLDKSKLPTAFFCHNDNVALGAMIAIQEAGYSVPKDFSLIGFDDIEESAFVIPSLTTVGNTKERLAAELVKAVLTISDNRVEKIRKEIIPELIIRETVRRLD